MKVTSFDGRTATEVAADQVQKLTSTDTPGFTWVDVRATGADDHEVAALLTSWGFSTVSASYAMRTDSAGVFTVLDNRIVGTTWLADADQASHMAEVHFAWDPHGFVTVRFGGDAAVQDVVRSVADMRTNLFDQPTAALGVLLQLFLGSVNRQITSLGEQLDTLDGQIIEAPHPDQMMTLRALRGVIIPLDRRLEPYADSVSEALVDASGLPGMDADGVARLQTYSVRLGDAVARLGDLTDQLRDCAQDFQTEVGNLQGNRINQLTIVSIVFLPISFLTGYFGMNFQWLDNETMSFGTWFVLGVVLPILAVVGSLVVLTRRGYLRRRADRRRSRAQSGS